MVVIVKSSIQIFVKTQAGNLLSIDCEQYDYIKDIKLIVSDRAGIPSAQQKFMFLEKELNDGNTLAYYKILNRSTIDLVLRVVGSITILVKSLKAKTIALDVFQNDSVEKLKMEIENKLGIPPGNQILICNDEILENGRMIADYNIIDQSTIHLNRIFNVIRLFVILLTGKKITINVMENESIENTKLMIQEKGRIPPEKQKLIFAGKELEDGKSLDDYEIKFEATLHLVIRIRGGGLVPKLVLLSGMKFNAMNYIEHNDFAFNGPIWADVGYGLSINGICLNIQCPAANQWVYKTLGYGQFDFRNIKNNLSVCPICNIKIQCNNILFIRSCWHHRAILENGTKISTKDNPNYTKKNKFATYLQGDDIEYQSLRIYVKEHSE